MGVDTTVLNVKALAGAFNQEKALVGAFSVITNILREPPFEALVAGTMGLHNYFPLWCTMARYCRR